MVTIKIIAAIGPNNELGLNNDLIWHLKEDLKFFREETTGHKIVMGYNTFLSLPNLLPSRTHIVLTHHEIADERVQVFTDFAELLAYLKTLEETVYVIGGASIYQLFLDVADELILTEIADESKADVYFPVFNKENYTEEVIGTYLDSNINYRRVRYRRRSK